MKLLTNALFAVGLIGLLAAPVGADFSTPVGSSETNHIAILDHIYGGDFSNGGSALPWGDTSYSNGTVTATRVDDWASSTPGSVGSNLNIVSGVPGLPYTDQIWDDGFTAAVAEARFASFSQKFGYYAGSSGTSYTELFNTSGTGFGLTGSASVDLQGHTWRWVREGTNGPHSSLDSDNADGANHLMTYQVTSTNAGFNDGKTTWLLFWEDQNLGDADYNDLVVEIRAIPAPGAVVLGVLGLGLVGWIKRRNKA